MTYMAQHDHLELNSGDTKIVTIKAVDRDLYTQFSELVNLSTAGSGMVFSHILMHYLRNIKPLVPVTPNRRLSNPSDKIVYEIIENQDSLRISEIDFSSIGMKMQFVFKNIKELIFDETVKTESFLKYVHSIKESNVMVLGKISKLVFLSIDLSNQISLDISNDVKDVTIRNVSVPVYEEFTALCYREQITIGEGMSRMLSLMIPHLEIVEIVRRNIEPRKTPPIIISLLKSVTINTNDLEELEDRSVLFHRIQKLEFSDEIPTELFTEKIIGIYNCDSVIFPKKIPKLLKLAKHKNYP